MAKSIAGGCCRQRPEWSLGSLAVARHCPGGRRTGQADAAGMVAVEAPHGGGFRAGLISLLIDSCLWLPALFHQRPVLSHPLAPRPASLASFCLCRALYIPTYLLASHVQECAGDEQSAANLQNEPLSTMLSEEEVDIGALALMDALLPPGANARGREWRKPSHWVLLDRSRLPAVSGSGMRGLLGPPVCSK